jgi:drug/metabolite transporter (DMT)-like permease
MPTAVRAAKSPPCASVTKKMTGADVSGNATSHPLTIGPKRRPVNVATAINAGVIVSLSASRFTGALDASILSVLVLERRVKTRDWLELFLLSLLWGGAFYFYKVLDNAGLPALTIVLGRVGIAALALLAVVQMRGLALPTSLAGWRPYLLLGLTNNIVPFALIAWGETQIASGLASILNATTPIFTAIVAHFATKDERFSANKIVGIALGFVGIIVLVGPGVVRGLSLSSLAQLGCVAACISYAFAAVHARKLRGTPPLVLSTGQLIASTVILLPVELALNKPWTLPPPTWETWLALLAMALLATSAPYILYFALIASAGAVNASAVTLIIPPVAIVLGGVFLHEHLTAWSIAGMLVILVGLIALDGRVFVRNY